MMRAHLRSQFDYDHWANNRIIEALDTIDTIPDRAISLLDHVFKAQMIWFDRIHNRDSVHSPAGMAVPMADLHKQCTEMYARWIPYLDELEEKDLDQMISYRNSKGKPFTDSLKNILQHVIIHGQHHRAQIAFMLRSAGAVPPVTDYIFFIRSGT